MADAQGMADALRSVAAVDDAERALMAALRALGARLGGGADELAEQLPAPLDGAVRGGAGPDAPPADEQGMARAVAARLG
ncbi:MAG TPA: DUF2267 domain-containing protein, partial [Baekduia sp.]|nr:DUF2267 domain-containing protein [Baekduia sp.]